MGKYNTKNTISLPVEFCNFLSLPSLPVALSNSRSLPVKQECDFQFPFPFPGGKKPFPLTPGPNVGLNNLYGSSLISQNLGKKIFLLKLLLKNIVFSFFCANVCKNIFCCLEFMCHIFMFFFLGRPGCLEFMCHIFSVMRRYRTNVSHSVRP